MRRFVEVFVDAPMETLLARDTEGMYRKALAHELTNVAGIDDPYEPPAHPELVVRTDQEKPDAALGRLFQKLVDMKYVTPAEFALLTGGQRPRKGGAKPPKVAAPRRQGQGGRGACEGPRYCQGGEAREGREEARAAARQGEEGGQGAAEVALPTGGWTRGTGRWPVPSHFRNIVNCGFFDFGVSGGSV